MANRIDTMFRELRSRGEKAFIAYITAGDPSLDETVERVLCLEKAGVDLVELGLPFSDPLADGRVNQESAARALAAGATFDGVLECVKKIREKSQIPLIFYAYMNPLLPRGFEQSMKMAAEAGIDGFLLLDLPVEEAEPYRPALDANGLHTVQLITPTTPDERIEKITKEAGGFIYCVSREGVTGVRSELASGAGALVERIRDKTALPVALGFGIGTPEQAADAAGCADAVVVGSAIVNAFHQAAPTPAGREQVRDMVGAMVTAVKQV